MIKIKKNTILKVRKHGDGNDPAKVAENAVSLLKSYGHSDDELAELSTADAAKLSVMFTSRRAALEEDVISRKGKELASAAELNGKKFAYKNSEERLRSAAAEIGITLSDEDLTPLEEKTRLEGIIKLVAEKVKAANPGSKDTPAEIKEWQAKYEGALNGQTTVQKTLKEREKAYKELEESIPLIKESLKAEFFVESNWKSVALDQKVIENLTINDAPTLTNIVMGYMAGQGHQFSAEKTADGKLRLTVIDKQGQPVQMHASMGNHTPETYIAAIYEPLVKKSNAGQGAGSPFTVKLDAGDMSGMDANSRKAIEKMGAQAKAVPRN